VDDTVELQVGAPAALKGLAHMGCAARGASCAPGLTSSRRLLLPLPPPCLQVRALCEAKQRLLTSAEHHAHGPGDAEGPASPRAGGKAAGPGAVRRRRSSGGGGGGGGGGAATANGIAPGADAYGGGGGSGGGGSSGSEDGGGSGDEAAEEEDDEEEGGGGGHGEGTALPGVAAAERVEGREVASLLAAALAGRRSGGGGAGAGGGGGAAQ
jgi:hypothetical protein